MQNRGEGFERERIVPEPGREVRQEGVEREPYREPVARERTTQPMTPEERRGLIETGLGTRAYDLTRWGPVFAGFFVALSLSVLLGVLGVAFGIQLASPTGAAEVSGTGAAIWAAVVLIVSFFVGGWLAARTTAISTPEVGLIHGVAVWAVTIAVLLVLGALGIAGVVSVVTGQGGPATAPAAPGSALSLAQGAAWGTFIAMLLGLVAAAIGGYVGGKNTGYERATQPRVVR